MDMNELDKKLKKVLKDDLNLGEIELKKVLDLIESYAVTYYEQGFQQGRQTLQ